MLQNGANPNVRLYDEKCINWLEGAYTYIGSEIDILHYVTRERKAEYVKLLVEVKADIDSHHYAFQKHGTPLGLAVEHNDFEKAKILIDAGSQVFKESKLYSPCLHIAIKHNNLKMVKLLLKHGASPDVENLSKNHSLPLQLASNSPEIFDLLLRYKADVENIRGSSDKNHIKSLVKESEIYGDILLQYNNNLDCGENIWDRISSMPVARQKLFLKKIKNDLATFDVNSNAGALQSNLLKAHKVIEYSKNDGNVQIDGEEKDLSSEIESLKTCCNELTNGENNNVLTLTAQYDCSDEYYSMPMIAKNAYHPTLNLQE